MPVSTVIAYIRVSTDEQADSGAGLEAQRRSIAFELDRRGWKLVRSYEDAQSGRSMARPGLQAALDFVESGAAQGLVVAKLDRLSRSLIDFAHLMERSRRRGWALVALDLGVDTASPSGEMLANVLAVFAQFERRLISQRTREALAVRRAEGVRIGRPVSLPPATSSRILRMRRQGLSLSEIARRLNARGVATAHGGERWHASTVALVLRRVAGDSAA